MAQSTAAGNNAAGNHSLGHSKSSAPSAEHSGFILLRNDRVLRGDVQIAGESVIVRQGGSEIRLPAKEVIGARDSLEALFELRQEWLTARTSPRPLPRALSAARWCVDQGLHPQAVQQLMDVYQIDPNNTEARHLESRLRNIARPDSPDSPSSDVQHASYVEMSETQVSAVSSTGTDEDQPLPIAPPKSTPTDRLHEEVMDSWLLHAFTARIQPILLARCAQCHDQSLSADAGDLRLMRPIHSSRPTRRITEANLREILKHCVPGDPAASPLVRMAQQEHGQKPSQRQNATFLPSDSALLKTLESFVDQLPRLSELKASLPEPNAPRSPIKASTHPVAAASFVAESAGTDAANKEFDSSPSWSPLENADVKLSPGEKPTIATTESEARDRPRRLPKVEQPLSKDLFNRQTELIELFRGTLPTRAD
ncbi:hypothetical protein [Rhodopirellula sp. P2]|uniref:hypothetical protein n=1 Tax=Rhodopirellula sp. P2 TaxID=2127060 RepID=UPI0023684984|nr:hypothetical protein [Rhodopirellula sp. P2]WDQ19283.1 hypothetical protein PSR62_12310 [Rhodopirellula sp. P2]